MLDKINIFQKLLIDGECSFPLDLIDQMNYLELTVNPFPPRVPIWHRITKILVLINLRWDHQKKIPISVATMSR